VEAPTTHSKFEVGFAVVEDDGSGSADDVVGFAVVGDDDVVGFAVVGVGAEVGAEDAGAVAGVGAEAGAGVAAEGRAGVSPQISCIR